MPIPGGIPFYDFKEIGYKIAILFGALIVIYGLLWLLAELGVIPAIIFAIFPQIVLILVGIFIIYTAVNRKNAYWLQRHYRIKNKEQNPYLFILTIFLAISLPYVAE